ncbi:MAG: ATP-binding protein [Kiritimatiellaeota bacterium]|nr:ATP-binding protein [Kiritimatiellota bacterium]
MSIATNLNATAPDLQRRLADYAMVLDLLGTLPGTMDEAKVIAAIRDLFTMLCAPAHIVYVPYSDNQPGALQCHPEGWTISPALKSFLADNNKLHAWSESDNGFLLRLTQAGETLGVMEIEAVAFPQYKTHYLNLALTIVHVCGLAVHNARTYERLRATIAERERAEREIVQLNAELKLRIHQVESANKELEAFSYSVSHDLRSPLHGIDGWSHVLLEEYADQFPAPAREHLQTIRGEVARMNELIRALLDLARVSRNEMHVEVVDLSAVCRELEKELRNAEPDRQVELLIAPGLTPQGDPVLLRAVLQNLLGNAWKFTRRRTPGCITFGAQQQAGITVYFVRDNGAGFDMAYAAKLFGPFQRLHAQKDFPGTGIGLATVQRIIHRHGGRVWAEGAVDQGATFYFTLNES